MLSVPLRSRFAIAVGGATATTVLSGNVKPLSSMSFSSDTNTEHKVLVAVHGERAKRLFGSSGRRHGA